jgi:hypothetical protein
LDGQLVHVSAQFNMNIMLDRLRNVKSKKKPAWRALFWEFFSPL